MLWDCFRQACFLVKVQMCLSVLCAALSYISSQFITRLHRCSKQRLWDRTSCASGKHGQQRALLMQAPFNAPWQPLDVSMPASQALQGWGSSKWAHAQTAKPGEGGHSRSHSSSQVRPAALSARGWRVHQVAMLCSVCCAQCVPVRAPRLECLCCMLWLYKHAQACAGWTILPSCLNTRLSAGQPREQQLQPELQAMGPAHAAQLERCRAQPACHPLTCQAPCVCQVCSMCANRLAVPPVRCD